MAAKRRAAQMREQLRMPPAPVGLRVTDVNDDSVELEWCSAEDHPPKGFDVQWKLYHQIQIEESKAGYIQKGTRSQMLSNTFDDFGANRSQM